MWPYVYCHYWLGIIRLDFIFYVSLLLVNMPSGTSWSSQSCPRCSFITQILPAEEGPGDTELLASDFGPVRKSFCSCGCETLSLRREGRNSVGSTFWHSHQSPHSSVYWIPLVGGGHFLFTFHLDVAHPISPFFCANAYKLILWVILMENWMGWPKKLQKAN